MQTEVSDLILTGSKDDIWTLIEESSEPFHVDWRDDEESIVECVAERIADELSGAWVEDPTDLEVTYKGSEVRLGLTMSPIDRSLTLAGLNRILLGDYEIRAFVVTVGTSDTLSCYVKPCAWWQRMEGISAQRTAEIFMKIPEGIDLFSLKV